MIIDEVSMGYTMEDYSEYEKLPQDKRKGMATRPALVAKIEHSMTKDGQAQFMEDILQIIGISFVTIFLMNYWSGYQSRKISRKGQVK